jgi:hypothetical protein
MKKQESSQAAEDLTTDADTAIFAADGSVARFRMPMAYRTAC